MPNYSSLRSTRGRSRIIAGLKRLRTQLEGEGGIPPKTLDSTLRLATWNIREFDSAKYGVGHREACYYIAEIVTHFDLVAVQEVAADLPPLDDLRGSLGGRGTTSSPTSRRAARQPRAHGRSSTTEEGPVRRPRRRGRAAASRAARRTRSSPPSSRGRRSRRLPGRVVQVHALHRAHPVRRHRGGSRPGRGDHRGAKFLVARAKESPHVSRT